MNAQIKEIIEKFSSNNYSNETQKEFYEWLVDEEHSDSKEKGLNDLWVKTDSKPTQKINTSYKKLLKKIEKPKKRSFELNIWRSVAGILIISTTILGFLTINNYGRNDQSLIEDYTPIALIDSIYLPDGSLVYKNAKTTLLYPSEFTGKTRSVYLIGEATFKVKKEKKPFIVKTSDITITALGTEFNVEAYPEENYISATLLSGSIAIDNLKEASQTIIKPEEQFTYNRDSHKGVVDKVKTEIVTAWIDGQIVINNKTIYEVIKILERQFNLDFQYNQSVISKTDNFNFKFRRNASIKEIMQVIQTVSGIQFIIEKNTCILY